MPNHYNYNNKDLDDLIDQWHEDNYMTESLEEFIRKETGFTHEEYADWVVTGEVPHG